MIEGTRGLLSRLRAVGESNKTIMRRLGVRAVANQKALVPRKTGNLGRSIRLARATDTSALTVAGANYAPFVEYDTRPHIIRPRQAKMLRFAAKGTPVTLSGRVRKAAASKPGAYRFARVVRHPGTKGQPFMVPGAIQALSDEGVAGVLVESWNRAD